ncbi:MAG: type III pantothenate kinase [Aquificaceae bacterium]|nr:type III pantothenate kinase [Aquificaceae bacterium]MDW8424066.1 type III pantothenate kinase [Aquificaceae bacterium]
MKILTVDVGNSSVDLCLYEEDFTYLGKFSHAEVPKVEADLVLVSSVKPSFEKHLKYTYSDARFFKSEEIPVRTAFEGKERVGIDRLLNIYGALRLYGQNLMVVSAGTALVVDLVIDGVFMGGFIAVGIGSGLDCLYRRAELIPEVKLRELKVSIGTNTEEALLGGAINQAVYFLRGCLSAWEREYGKELKVVITGGDGWLLERMGVYDPLLIHKAMVFLAGF